jgi:isopentenyldiphosphate isomerase
MELLDIVDETGEPTGKTITREEAHRRGIRHRTSHVWLFRIRNGKAQVLLQKRSRDKDSFPGCYDISSAGHIQAGDNFLPSALRELKEELGIEAGEDELIFCGQRRFTFRDSFHGQVFLDSQVSNVYALWFDAEAEAFQFQRSEIEAVLWMDWYECVEMVKKQTAPNCIWMEELEMLSAAEALQPYLK